MTSQNLAKNNVKKENFPVQLLLGSENQVDVQLRFFWCINDPIAQGAIGGNWNFKVSNFFRHTVT